MKSHVVMNIKAPISCVSILCNFPPKTRSIKDMWAISLVFFFYPVKTMWQFGYSGILTKNGAKDLSKTIWCSESK